MKRSKFLKALGLFAVAPVAIAKVLEAETIKVNPIDEIPVDFEVVKMKDERNFYYKPWEYIKKSDFCYGWEEGYCEGWEDVKGEFSVCPVAPPCPVPDIGQNNYRGGYNKGFKKGRSDANE